MFTSISILQRTPCPLSTFVSIVANPLPHLRCGYLFWTVPKTMTTIPLKLLSSCLFGFGSFCLASSFTRSLSLLHTFPFVLFAQLGLRPYYSLVSYDLLIVKFINSIDTISIPPLCSNLRNKVLTTDLAILNDILS